MRSPRPPAINLPYASTVASYASDQGGAFSGGAFGNSFLGRLFRRGGADRGTNPSMTGQAAGQGMLK